MNIYRKQQGVALVVSLIILVSLTMLGLTSIQRTTTDLAMAGNQRETGLMFQSAEIGLIQAENFIGTVNSNGDFFNNTDGMYAVPQTGNYNSIDYFGGTIWGTAESKVAATNLNTDFGIKAEPRYIVEYLGERQQNPLAKVNIGGYGQQQPGDIVSIYRPTARGVGLTGNSFRYLQSYFGKKIN